MVGLEVIWWELHQSCLDTFLGLVERLTPRVASLMDISGSADMASAALAVAGKVVGDFCGGLGVGSAGSVASTAAVLVRPL